MNFSHFLSIKRIVVAIYILTIQEFYAVVLADIVKLNCPVIAFIKFNSSVTAIFRNRSIMRITCNVNKVLCFGRSNTIIYINLNMKMFDICFTTILYSTRTLRLISNRLGIVNHMSSITLTIFFCFERRVFFTHLFNGRNITSCINIAVLRFPDITCIGSTVRSCNWEVAGDILSIQSSYGLYCILLLVIVVSITIIRISIPFIIILEIPSTTATGKMYITYFINITIKILIAGARIVYSNI